MQKKNHPQENSASNWEDNLKKQQRSDMMKKVALWGGIVIACIAGLAILVKLAQTSGPSVEPVVNQNLKPVSSNDMVLGDPNAKVVIYEYADFQCPACAAYNPIVNQVLAQYDGKVKVVYRHFPLKNIHSNAVIAGQAGYAAWKLDKFEEMKNELFNKQGDWEALDDPRSVFVEYAQGLGMDPVKFEELMNSPEAKKAVEDSEREAIALGLNSTPSFFIGNKQFSPSGIEGFKTLIDAELSGEVTQKPLQ